MTAADDLLVELRVLVARSGPDVTLVQFCREVGVAPGTVARFWGSWTKLRLAARLPARARPRRIQADERRLRGRRRVRQFRSAGSLLLWGLVICHGASLFHTGRDERRFGADRVAFGAGCHGRGASLARALLDSLVMCLNSKSAPKLPPVALVASDRRPERHSFSVAGRSRSRLGSDPAAVGVVPLLFVRHRATAN